MQYAQLGRTGLKVSRLTLGTMNFGRYTSEADSFAIMDRALELGCNFFDTANVYGGKEHRGWTEEILGRWFAQGGGRRDKIVLATKVYGMMAELPNQNRLSAYHIRRACDDSLRRLQTDHIDLYQMHHIDRLTPWEEIWQAMDVLIQQGKITYVGGSNFPGWHIARAQGVAQHRNMLGLVSEQGLYNLKVRMAELEVLPACRALGLAFLPWSPLAGGLLGGVLQKAASGSRRMSPEILKQMEAHRPKLEAYESLCRDLGHPPGEIALAWTLQNPVVTSAIIGPRTVEQLNESLKALEVKFGEGDLRQLADLWPGPGEAPEAYAW